MTSVETSVDRGFLLAEDQALKAKVSRLYVPGPDGTPQRVKVWYGMPSRERQAVYPFITIDLIDVVFANDRAHSAQVMPVDFWPSEYASMEEYAAANGIVADTTVGRVEAMWFHPYDIYYQIAVHTREPRHDRRLTAALLGTNFLPLSGFGYLDVPADGSCRRLENLGWSSQDYQGSDQKWVHRKVHNVKVSAHMPPENPFFFRQVLEVHGQLYGIRPDELLDTWEHVAPAE